MNTEFPRILTLLRKEKGISQKSAAAQLSISQALLSHYEKGIRECGLDFLVRCATFYDVSCDYLLGLSPDRKGHTLSLEDIPDPEEIGKENRYVTGVLPVLHKKLISNSLNVLYDLLIKARCRSLTGEVSAFLSLAVYRMFRVVYAANPKNQDAMFGVPAHVCAHYASAAMQISEANAISVAEGQPVQGLESLTQVESLSVSTEQLEEEYPLFAPSLLNLIQTAERRIAYKEKAKKQA